MTQPGYQESSEPRWWWKVALHLDEAQLALANAMAHNVDDPRPAHALYHRLREGQAILLEIFRAKGLLPGSTNGKIEAQLSEMPMPPKPPGVPVPTAAAGGETNVEQHPPIAAEEPAIPEAGQDAAAFEPEQPAAVTSPEFEPEQPATGASPEAASPAAIASEAPMVAPPADPGAGGAGG